MVLASIIPSNAARSGGVILPILRSIAELYGSQPGPTAALLGSFLMTAMYQNICITAAMFFTGQASNPLAAQIASNQLGHPVTWTSWLVAGIVPGLCSLLLVPLLVVRLTSPLHGLDITVTALLGSSALLVSGVLTWEDVKNERAAWDIFIWYGGLLRLGKALNDTGVTTAFANGVGSVFAGMGWVTLFGFALLIYFYAHYGFASITAHILAIYSPFLAVLAAKGAPAGLIIYAF